MFGLNARIEGSPIVADVSPNTTQPDEKRIVTVGLKNSVRGGTLDLYLFLLDGTSADATAWVKIPELDLTDPPWFELNPALTVLDLEIGVIQGVPAQASIFVQVTNPVGNPTKLGLALI